MNSHRHRVPRPVIWGFFISLGVGLAALVWRFVEERNVESHWEQIKTQQLEEQRTIVGREFEGRVQRLLRVARRVAADVTIQQQSAIESPRAVAEIFRCITEVRQSEPITIELVDPTGAIIAWSGESVVPDYRSYFEIDLPDSFALVVTSDLHTYLSVTKAFGGGQLYVVVSEFLEGEVPTRAENEETRSFTQYLSEMLGVTPTLVPVARASQFDLHSLIPLKGFSGEPIAYVSIPELTKEEVLDSVKRYSNRFAMTGFALGILFAALIGFGFVWVREERWGRYLGMVILVWTIRYAWILLGFPGEIVGGWLFDPSLYASPFGYGLAASLGDTFLSTLALGTSALLLLRLFLLSTETVSRALRKLGQPLFTVFLVMLAVGLCFLLRAYAASVRSFVFDSTLSLHDPATVFPTLPVATMYGILLLLSIICVGTVVVVVRLLHHSTEVLTTAPYRRLAISTLLLTAGIGIYLQLDQLNLFSPLLAGVLFCSPLGLIHTRQRVDWTRDVGILAFLAVSSFVLSIVVVDRMAHDKERLGYEEFAGRFIRPADAWFTVLVDEAIHDVQGTFKEQYHEGIFQSRKLAFTLWSSTMLSKRGYNSALVVYDLEGKETSRFGVGMASYEQNEQLFRVFNLDEEVVHVLEQEVRPSVLKYYGAWSTLRDHANTLRGYVAVLLSVSQHVGGGRGGDPFRAEAGPPPFRKVFITTYNNGVLASTTHPSLSLGETLPAAVAQRMRDSQDALWIEEVIDQEEYQSLYLRGHGRDELVVRMSVEPLDLRWHLFNVLKIAWVYFLIALLGGVSWWVVKARVQQGSVRLGFREKLILTILLAVVIPIVVLGYYNRQLANERSEEILVEELERQLSLIGRRIDHAIQSEEDFLYGMTDDFCSSIAKDVGVEFSIFRHAALLASSRRDLYDAGMLDSRLLENAFSAIVLMKKDLHISFERAGEVDYATGFKPIRLGNRRLGVLSVTTLSRQHEVERELIERNAFTIGIYACVLVLTIGIGLTVAHRLSQPLKVLQKAAQEIGRGNLTTSIQSTSNDEIGDLIKTFNEMTAQLKRHREELARVERELAWKEMAKQVAHEIKNPLTPIRLSIQHLRQAFNDRSKDLGRIVDHVTTTILEQIDALARIANEFSNFSRMPEPRYERVDLHRLIGETIHLFHGVEGVEFRVKFSDTTPLIIADKDEIRRVLVNIIRNSIQAMAGSGRVTIQTTANNGVCTLLISDTGSGIPPEIRDKVFQPSFSTKTEGMGLGLAISRKIVEDLNGSISLTSEMGKGTTIIIKLPYRQ